MSELLTGSCPNCGCRLSYDQNTHTVTCFACDSVLNTSELNRNSSATSAANAAYGAFMGFDNPESGVVFLENFFATYDWEAYQLLPDITIPELVTVIGNNKIKNGAVPETWYLDFMSLYVPVLKKFEGLASFEKNMIDQFNPIDPTEIFASFDNYKLVASALLEEKESIFKSLNSSIEYAERFSISGDRLSEMNNCLAELKQKYNTLSTETVNVNGETKTVIVEKIEQLKSYDVAKEAYAAKANSAFSARGIDAKEVYARAVKAYEDNKLGEALLHFENIRAYSDSSLYIRKINQYFSFFGEVYRFGGKYFIYKKEDYSHEALDLKQLSKRALKKAKKNLDASGTVNVVAYALYEIKDCVPAEEPTVKGIDKVITSYGTKLFYFKNSEGIAYYDFADKSEAVIDKGQDELYKINKGDYEFEIAKSAPVFYVKKKFSKDLKGCFGKKKGVMVNETNPYTLVLVNMSKCTAEVAVDKLVEIKLSRDDKIFYNVITKGTPAKLGCLGKKDEKPQSHLMACELATGKSYQVLDEDCDICEVKGDLIFYTLWKNNELNRDLHVYNMKTSEDTLIENNVYDFFNVIDNKVYYTIGNRDFRPLVRANFDGTEREQVMLNVKKMEMIRGGWFYVTKGTGVNTVLVKIRADGKATRVLATSIKKIVRFDGNYIYYSDFNDNLHVVRIDGAGEKIVAKDVEKIFPAEDGLYYCRKELVNNNETDLSLYHMDKDGKNIRKIVFNVDRVQDDPISNTIYYSKFENIRYKVYKPGKENKAHYEFLNITKFYSMKKAESGKPAGAPEIFLTLGLPEHEKKKGCLAKFKKDYVYEEAPIPHSYKTRGMTDEEIMAEEEANAPAKTPSWLPVPSILTKKRASKPNLTAALIGGCIKGCSPKK